MAKFTAISKLTHQFIYSLYIRLNNLLIFKKQKSIKDVWQARNDQLKSYGIILQDAENDLIDLIWPADERTPKPSTLLMIHDVKYAGTFKFDYFTTTIYMHMQYLVKNFCCCTIFFSNLR